MNDIEIRCSAVVEAEEESVSRRISGTIATYGEVVHPFGAYESVRLVDGALSDVGIPARVKLLREHEITNVIGAMEALEFEGPAVTAAFKVGRTPGGDEALSLAADGILDGLSVGYRVLDGQYVTENGEEIYEVTKAELREVSLVAWPADSTARVSDVAAKERKTAMADIETLAAQVAELKAQMEKAPEEAAPVVQTEPAGLVQARENRPYVVTKERSAYPGVVAADGTRITAGDYLSAFYKARQNGEWTDLRTIQAKLADEVSGDVPGLLPQQIVGELLNRASGARPVWNSLTPKPMPMIGEKFSRPVVTQHTLVDEQVTQKTEVVSRKYTVGLVDVVKKTFAGGLDISYQVIDWTSPAVMNQLVEDLTNMYLARTDKYAADSIVAAAALGTPVTWTAGDASGILKMLTAAAAAIYTAIPEDEIDPVMDIAWCSVDVWEKLASVTATDGRPYFPFIGPMNSVATSNPTAPVAGFQNMTVRWVVSRRFPANTLIFGDSSRQESYENGRRFLQAQVPGLLGMDIATMGYVATFFPDPKTLVPVTITTPPAATAEKK